MKKNVYLAVVALFLFLALGLISLTTYTVPSPYEKVMVAAAQKTAAAFKAIKEERLLRGLAWDKTDDPNDTGLIGLPFSGITTTLGPLDAKRSTTNPNVAAMIVKMLFDLDIKPGDKVAFNFSGSFPCLNIAALCAAEAMGLNSVSMFSIGASTYGANIPDFSYGDMEIALYSQGLISHKSSYFSYGGDEDMGMEMDKNTKTQVAQRLKALGYEQILIEPLAENVLYRHILYKKGGDIAAFINIGGNVLSFGADEWMHTKKSGILTTPLKEGSGSGLIQRFLNEGIPVVQILNMKELLPGYGLPIDPVPLPKVGEGGIYQEEVKPTWLTAIFMFLGLTAILLYKKLTSKASSQK